MASTNKHHLPPPLLFGLLACACASLEQVASQQQQQAFDPSAYVTHSCDATSVASSFANLSQTLADTLAAIQAGASSAMYINATASGSSSSSSHVFAAAQCRLDLSQDQCRGCVAGLVDFARQNCSGRDFAWVLFDGCVLEYRPDYFFFFRDTRDQLAWSCSTQSGGATPERDDYAQDIGTLLSAVSREAPKRGGFNSSVLVDDGSRAYGLAQCLGYLPPADCGRCLSSLMPASRGKCGDHVTGMRAYYSSCFYQFENFPFFNSRGEGVLRPSTGNKSSKIKIILVVVALIALVSLLVGCAFLVYWFIVKRRHKPKREEMVGFDYFALVKFSYSELQQSCSNFHANTKLGEGGFGAVYKGTLLDGTNIAIKRLYAQTKQGDQEFMNEVNLITTVQHMNLIRLLGCCVEPERLLVYEYLPNQSLDKHLFDCGDKPVLGWHTRCEIIIGTAHGLAYLHEYSRIVHRDIKASNILLDEDFTPKIADFGIARLFCDDKSHVITKVVGTFGYLAPEYLVNGRLTKKADVFSFGILTLETISGKRNIDRQLLPQSEGLLEKAWRVYEENGKLAELVDPRLGEDWVMSELERLVYVALLCVQEVPEQRPMMSRVSRLLTRQSNDLGILSKPLWMS